MNITNRKFSRPAKFLIAGGSAAAVEYIVFLVIMLVAKDNFLIIGQAVSYLTGFMISFWLQRNWVFKSGGAIKGELAKYCALAGINLLLSAVIIWVLVNPLDVMPLAAKVIVMSMVALWNYFIFGKIVFSEGNKQQ